MGRSTMLPDSRVSGDDADRPDNHTTNQPDDEPGKHTTNRPGKHTTNQPGSEPGNHTIDRAGKPTVVLLVRHGQTPTTGSVLPGRTPGLHLSATGKVQAQQAAQRIARLGRIAAVYSSPMERTVETAALIARECGTEMRTNERLNECDFGRWTGCELRQLRKLKEWKRVQHKPSGFRFPGGESFIEIQTRVTGAVTDIVARHQGETVVAVSHADVIKALVAEAVGTPLDKFQRIVISLCSISVIVYRREKPMVLTVNNTGGDFSILGIAETGRAPSVVATAG